MNRVVPVAAKSLAHDIQAGHRVRDLRPLGVKAGVEFAAYPHSRASSCRRDQVDGDRKARQWSSSPALADERESAVFDLVSLDRPGRQVARGNGQAALGGQWQTLQRRKEYNKSSGPDCLGCQTHRAFPDKGFQ